MGTGMSEFAEGLVRSLADKAERKALSVEGQFASEQDEICILRAALAARLAESLPPEEAQEARAFAGLIELAGYLMGVDDHVPSNRSDFDRRIRARAQRFGEIMENFDTAFDAACEHSSIIRSGEAAYEATFKRRGPSAVRAAG
jgi:hypothetical protein